MSTLFVELRAAVWHCLNILCVKHKAPQRALWFPFLAIQDPWQHLGADWDVGTHATLPHHGFWVLIVAERVYAMGRCVSLNSRPDFLHHAHRVVFSQKNRFTALVSMLSQHNAERGSLSDLLNLSLAVLSTTK